VELNCICRPGASSDIWFLCFKVKENNYRGHGDSVDQLCWHPSNPDLFVTASGDKTIRIWDVRTTKCIATVNTKGDYSERALGRQAPTIHLTAIYQVQSLFVPAALLGRSIGAE
jgi:WD40 repeat protein